MKAASVLTMASLIAGSPAGAADDRLTPYVAEYSVKYGSLRVGTSRTELSRAPSPGQWVMETRLSASGLGKLFADNLVQHSSFRLDEADLRPLHYHFDDGTKHSSRDVALNFDWSAGRVTGVAEGSPVDVPVEPGLQDAASNQAMVQVLLGGGAEPGTIPMIEKDHIKYYRFTLLRRERLATEIGVLDTVVYRSSRDGSSRENIFWYAPELGFVIERAEQRRDGNRLFQTYIRNYRPGA